MDFLDWDQFRAATAGCGGKFFEVEFICDRQNSKNNLLRIDAAKQSLEDLLQWEADLFRHSLTGEIVEIDRVLASFVRNRHHVQHPAGVCLHAEAPLRGKVSVLIICPSCMVQ